MKVLIVANYAKEHINYFHLSTIKRFKELGWQVDVACCADDTIPYCDTVYNLPMERNPFRPQTFSAIKQLRKIIEREKYDVVHCHTYAGKFIGVLAAAPFRKHGVKVVYTSHGFQYFKGASPLAWALFLPIDWLLARKMDVLITMNEEDHQTVEKFRFPVKHLAHCNGAGIKIDRFARFSNSRSETRSQLGIADDTLVMIYVAELNVNKNQSMLLKMLAEVHKQIPDCCLLLVGKDHSSGRIPRQIENAKASLNIQWLGWRSDVPDLLRAADIAVASSIREGLPLNIMESMYCKLPVVATSNRGHRELITDDVSGYLVDTNDYRTMANRVVRLAQNPSLVNTFTQQAYNNILKYSDDCVVEQITEIYNEYLL